MLINTSTQKIIRVLLNSQGLTLRELSKEANVSLSTASKIIYSLQETGYAKFSKGAVVVRNFENLLKFWSLSVSLSEKKKIEFSGAERPPYLMKKISSIGKKKKLTHAFTSFAGADLVCPYVSPNEVHLYILEKEAPLWEKAMKEQNIFPAEKGNITCFLADESCFYGQSERHGINVISLPQLFADLFPLKGRAEEAAEKILEMIKNV